MPLPKQKSIACRACNSRKVKCSGGKPCKNCDSPQACVYPPRDRQVRVSQSYINRILRENEQLRMQNHAPVVREDAGDDDQIGTDPIQNPLLQDQPWFANFMTRDMPIWIGEAADAAFATRLAQLLTASGQDPGHIPRTSYVMDAELHESAVAASEWPTHGRAQFLAQAALRSLCRCYHIVRASHVLACLDRVGDDGENFVTKCKLYAIFAIGELYALRSKGDDDSFPGLSYFAKANRMLEVIQERPSLDVIETMLLLSLYSLQVNRRHAAYTLAGCAVRLATVMGLHLSANINVQDPETREHRKRVWWTAYTFDRMWASRVGLPHSIADEDILVELPAAMETTQKDDFVDHEYLIASVRLARLAGITISSIYRRNNPDRSFSKRVHSTLQQLHNWAESLPASLQLSANKETMGREVSLHLSFNQCLILATRPILLSVLRSHLHSAGALGSETSEVARSVSEACIRYARHSYSLLVNCWISGTFHVFDFFYTQYLFSSSTVLGIAALLQTEKAQSDLDGLSVACGLLKELERNGNFAAREYCLHMDRILSKVSSLCARTDDQSRAPEREPKDLAQDQLIALPEPTFAGHDDLGMAEDPLLDFLGDASFEWELLDSLTYHWE